MKYITLSFFISLFLFSSCKIQQQKIEKSEDWNYIGLIEDVEIFVNTSSIRQEGNMLYAQEKRVFKTPESKKLYVDKIKEKYAGMGKPEKINKWNDFSYCIYDCIYDCTNKRFRIIGVQDFDSAGKPIIKTTHAKNDIKWIDVVADTVGDYTFFSVCDYDN